MQVAVAGGKPPYMIGVEYGDKGAAKKKTPESLENPGTVQFKFEKELDWPRPITISFIPVLPRFQNIQTGTHANLNHLIASTPFCQGSEAMMTTIRPSC